MNASGTIDEVALTHGEYTCEEMDQQSREINGRVLALATRVQALETLVAEERTARVSAERERDGYASQVEMLNEIIEETPDLGLVHAVVGVDEAAAAWRVHAARGPVPAAWTDLLSDPDVSRRIVDAMKTAAHQEMLALLPGKH